MNANIEKLLIKIKDKIDLSTVREALMEEFGREDREADHYIGLYQMFLCLCVLKPRTILEPNSGISDVWELHLRDTKKYWKDCESVLGRMVHRSVDPETLQYTYSDFDQKTYDLFKEFFDVDMTELPPGTREDTLEGGG